MQHMPEQLWYTECHTWLRLDVDGCLVVGLTDFGVEKLGEIMHASLPEVGLRLHAGDEVVSLEATQGDLEVLCGVSGQITAVNEDLELAPGLMNRDPYGDGWLFKIKPRDQEELDDLLDTEGYQSHLSEVEA